MLKAEYHLRLALMAEMIAATLQRSMTQQRRTPNPEAFNHSLMRDMQRSFDRANQIYEVYIERYGRSLSAQHGQDVGALETSIRREMAGAEILSSVVTDSAATTAILFNLTQAHAKLSDAAYDTLYEEVMSGWSVAVFCDGVGEEWKIERFTPGVRNIWTLPEWEAYVVENTFEPVLVAAVA